MLTGRRRRSAFITNLIRRALDDEQRWDEIEATLGSIPESGHEWDDDPQSWVHSKRHTDTRRLG